MNVSYVAKLVVLKRFFHCTKQITFKAVKALTCKVEVTDLQRDYLEFKMPEGHFHWFNWKNIKIKTDRKCYKKILHSYFTFSFFHYLRGRPSS